MLEECDKIDATAITKDGKLELVVMDAGLTEDPEERYQHLIEKLKVYLFYLTKGDFKKDHPDRTATDTQIRVMCKLPPTDKMSQMSAVRNPDNPSEVVVIVFQHFPGADGKEDEGKELPESPCSRVPTYPAASNMPVHITFVLLFLYIAATRYLVYFGPASQLHKLNAAQAIGATLGYLFVWALGYWFCATSVRKTLVTWLGGLAVFLSTLIGSFVGFILLFVIFPVHRAQQARSVRSAQGPR